MSLRLRLIAIIAFLFVLSTATSTAYIVLTAKNKVRNEVQSVATLTSELLDLITNRLPLDTNTDIASTLNKELANLNGIRHLSIQIQSPVQSSSNNLTQTSALDNKVAAPSWFVNMVRPAQEELIFSIPQSNGTQLLIHTNPNDEIEEVWEETRTSMVLGFSIATLFCGVLFYSVGRWLKPINAIVTGLNAIERGDYSQRIPNLSLPELKQIANQFNQLSEGLEQSKAENDRLNQRTLEIKEQERRHLAQELHDEMGQAISAIKAIAVANLQHNKNKDPTNVAQVSDIEHIADRIYNSVRHMMSQLRPAVLDELGLVAALQQMTDEWNDHHADTFCSFKIKGHIEILDRALTDNQKINIYRIIQEALTNTAKHAQAQNISISLDVKSEADLCTVSIIDDGIGYDSKNNKQGMGLIGIKERINALRGNLVISSNPQQGVTLQIQFPIEDTATQ